VRGRAVWAAFLCHEIMFWAASGGCALGLGVINDARAAIIPVSYSVPIGDHSEEIQLVCASPYPRDLVGRECARPFYDFALAVAGQHPMDALLMFFEGRELSGRLILNKEITLRDARESQRPPMVDYVNFKMSQGIGLVCARIDDDIGTLKRFEGYFGNAGMPVLRVGRGIRCPPPQRRAPFPLQGLQKGFQHYQREWHVIKNLSALRNFEYRRRG
jgi:hypothetical protein